MNRAVVAAATGAAALAAAAPAGAFQFTVEPSPLIPHDIQKIERAVSFQLNRQLSRFYPIGPVSFVASGGDPIRFVNQHQLERAFVAAGGDVADSATAAGFHTFDWKTGTHPIWVWPGPGTPTTSEIVSHEAVETETDPTTTGTEIADPFTGSPYWLLGERVANWETSPGGLPYRYTKGAK